MTSYYGELLRKSSGVEDKCAEQAQGQDNCVFGVSSGVLELLGSVLERPGRLLGRLGAVLVAFKVVLDVKMSSESVQDPKSSKNHSFCKVFLTGDSETRSARRPARRGWGI